MNGCAMRNMIWYCSSMDCCRFRFASLGCRVSESRAQEPPVASWRNLACVEYIFDMPFRHSRIPSLFHEGLFGESWGANALAVLTQPTSYPKT